MPPVPRQTPVGSSRRFAHLSLRLLLLLIGMFTAALGVALTTVADLGTTPSVRFHMPSLCSRAIHLAQPLFREPFSGCGSGAAPSSAVFALESSANTDCSHFGICIDLAMAIVSPHAPAGWWTGLLMSISGNFVLALGIVMQIRSKPLSSRGRLRTGSRRGHTQVLWFNKDRQ